MVAVNRLIGRVRFAVGSGRLSPRGALLASACALGCVGVAAGPTTAPASAATFSPVPGSPFATGNGPSGVAYSASGGLVAVANHYDQSLSIFTVAPDGSLDQAPGSPVTLGGAPQAAAFSSSDVLVVAAGQELYAFTAGDNGGLTPAPGSPFSYDGDAHSVAFSPNGELLVVGDESGQYFDTFSVAANGALSSTGQVHFAPVSPVDSVAFSRSGLLAVSGGSEVAMYTVAADGSVTLAPGSPYATGDGDASSVAFGAGGQLAVTNEGSNTVSTFTAAANGSLTPAPGSPFATGTGPISVAADATGNLAVANNTDDTVSLFSAAANGSLAQEPGSPSATGAAPASAAFGPNGLLAIANTGDATVSEFSSSAPRSDLAYSFPQSDPTLEPDGQTFTEQMLVRNLGPSASSPSAMQLYVPAHSGVSIISYPRGGQRSGQTVTWSIPGLAAGGGIYESVTLKVGTAASGMVQLTGSTPVPANDSDPADNTAVLPIALSSGG